MSVPYFMSYGEYASSNYGVNALVFRLPNGVRFYYSYKTLVAFESIFSGLHVRKNAWSTTTGKHLNWIDGGNKKARLDEAAFNEELKLMLANYGLDQVQEGG